MANEMGVPSGKYGTLASLDGMEPHEDSDTRDCLGSRYVSLRFGELAVQVPYDRASAAMLDSIPGREYDDRAAFKEWRFPIFQATRLKAMLPRLEAVARSREAEDDGPGR